MPQCKKPVKKARLMATLQEPVTFDRNGLLGALPRRDRDRLLPSFESVALSPEEILYEPNEPIRHVYFPMSGLISLVLVLKDGSIAEVARVGREGIVGLPAFLGVQTSHTRAFVQVPGEALRLKAQTFVKEARNAGPFTGLLLRYTQT